MVLRAFNYAVGKRRARLRPAGGLVPAFFRTPARSTPAGALRPAPIYAGGNREHGPLAPPGPLDDVSKFMSRHPEDE